MYPNEPAAHYALANKKKASSDSSPIFFFVYNKADIITLNRVFNASHFFFNKECPFYAPIIFYLYSYKFL